MAKRLKANTVNIDGGHLAMLSHPKQLSAALKNFSEELVD